MIVDLEDKEEKGSFELKGGGKVHLRLLSGADLKAMRKACMTVSVEYPLLEGKYQRFEAPKFDGELFDSMKWDRVITGWDLLFDRNEKQIPVTPENKVLLMERVLEFAEAVNEGLKSLKEAEKTRTEQAEKNLPIGSSSGKSKPGPKSSLMAG
jgi:hypothetical protein